MTVTEITSDTQFNEILNNTSGDHKYVLVDFYAQWCGPCKAISPKLHKLSETYTNITFVKVDVDELQTLSEKYKITSLPTFLIFDIGKTKPINKIVGSDIKKLENALKVVTANVKILDDF